MSRLCLTLHGTDQIAFVAGTGRDTVYFIGRFLRYARRFSSKRLITFWLYCGLWSQWGNNKIKLKHTKKDEEKKNER